MQLSLWSALACCALPLGWAQGPVMEIEFEPLGAMPGVGDDRAAPEMLQDLLAGMARANGGRSPGAEREGELDRAMAAFLGARPPAGGGPKTTKWTSPDGSQQVVIEEISPKSDKRSRLPAGLFRDLFPGPLLMEEDGADPLRSLPFGGPDPLILDMLQGMGRPFQQDMLPALHRSSGGGTRAPRSCQADLGKHCGKERSQVHCLGQHQDDISEACRQDVGKSVPFLCSRAIDRYCDVLQTGILTCLGGHLQDLDGQCSDAVIATRHVISKVNSQRASIKVNDQTTQPPLPAALGSVTLSAAGATTQQGKRPSEHGGAADNNFMLLETTADLVAEALKHHPVQRQSWFPWRFVVCGLLIGAAAYAWAFTDSSKRVYSAFKPYMHVDEDSKPLRGGVELPKPLAL
mmetsp:Transcript_48040/g.139144  ORF Transcript_48040/g.139144 Transcript_48040/m.139144 type:complete len:404 (-) Transcript_48040:70-1281(-)